MERLPVLSCGRPARLLESRVPQAWHLADKAMTSMAALVISARGQSTAASAAACQAPTWRIWIEPFKARLLAARALTGRSYARKRSFLLGKSETVKPVCACDLDFPTHLLEILG